MAELFLGLMSGTSLDGVDGVLVEFAPVTGSDAPLIAVLAHVHQPFQASLRSELLELNTSGVDELHRAAISGNALARLSAEVVAALLSQAQAKPEQVQAIGVHGQTVRHRPGAFDGIGYSLQINNPALLAELSSVNVVADFRSRDVAAGGQGAPLVPAFHREFFGRPGETSALLNLGGISNLTILAANGLTEGFDCGPANVLMDHWCTQHTGRPFDAEGAWAATGKVHRALLDIFLTDPYFSLAPPKSTGRDQFSAAWLAKHLQSIDEQLPPEDVQATLCQLTAITCSEAVSRSAKSAKELLICGGGALNTHLMVKISEYLPGVNVLPTDARGLPAMQVEAVAFAWLARAHMRREAGNLCSVTGASGPRVLGAMYPAS